MINMVRSLDRSWHTITIGTCSMIPAVHLIKHLGELHPDMTISSDQKSLEELMEGLQNNTYQYIILPHIPPNTEYLHIEKLMEEHLYFNLPKTHPLVASILPSFTTDQAMKEYNQPVDRIPVLINDPEVNINFYVISKKNNFFCDTEYSSNTEKVQEY